MSLFRFGDFTLASGLPSKWKIECDAFDGEDWATLALMIAERCGPFGEVVGVPRGGIPLADALRGYGTSGRRLIVDDVLTTGGSLARLKAPDDMAWVVFARGPCPPGVNALFQMPVSQSSGN